MLGTSSFAILASVAVAAASLEARQDAFHLPLTQRFNAKSSRSFVENRRARTNKPNSTISGPAFGAITNEEVVYVANVLIGGVSQSLVVDTGSPYISCYQCEPTQTGRSLGHYSSSGAGTYWSDSVEFAGLTVLDQMIIDTTSFSGADGFFGLGPKNFAQGTSNTWLDNLYSSGKIATEELGISFYPEPNSSDNTTNGVLTIGGVNSTLYTGALKYFPKLTSGTDSAYWGIGISNFSYGSTVFAGFSCIIDTGTTLIYIPTTAYNHFLSASGGTTDPSSGLAEFPQIPTQNFTFDISASHFPLTPSQYLVPQAQYGFFGLQPGKYYAWITDSGSTGVDCIIGQKFIEAYYTTLDTTNSRIGFAPEAIR